MNFAAISLCIITIFAVTQARPEIASPGSSSSRADRVRRCGSHYKDVMATECSETTLVYFYNKEGVCTGITACRDPENKLNNFATEQECQQTCGDLGVDLSCPGPHTVPADCVAKSLDLAPICPVYVTHCPQRVPTGPCPELPPPVMDVALYDIKKENGCMVRIVGGGNPFRRPDLHRVITITPPTEA